MGSKDTQVILYDKDKVLHSRMVARLRDSQKWSMDKVAGVKVRPESSHVAREPTVTFREQIRGEQNQGTKREFTARNLYLKRTDFTAFGHTDECKRCEHDQAYRFGRGTQ